MLRGLTWTNVDLENREIKVTQRADRYNAIGNPKSEDGDRTVPTLPLVANALKEWKLRCPKGDLGLAFPDRKGSFELHNAIVTQGLAGAGGGRGCGGRQGEIYRPPCPTALLRVLVH